MFSQVFLMISAFTQHRDGREGLFFSCLFAVDAIIVMYGSQFPALRTGVFLFLLLSKYIFSFILYTE